jgi:hypothetical protein
MTTAGRVMRDYSASCAKVDGQTVGCCGEAPTLVVAFKAGF